MDQNSKLEQLRATLDTLSSCCADKATEAKLEQCRLLLNDILNAIPGAGSGNYALETSMQGAITKLQSILDRITSVEADLGYDALLDPLDTQKATLDDIQGGLDDLFANSEWIEEYSGMTAEMAEDIFMLLQSLYDDCCPNALLTEIRNRVATETTLQAIQSALATEATLQLLLTCCNQRGTEATLNLVKAQAEATATHAGNAAGDLSVIKNNLPSTSALALEATLQLLLTCCNQRGTEATLNLVKAQAEAAATHAGNAAGDLSVIKNNLPSTSALALEATLQLLLTCCNGNNTLLSQIESYSAQTYDVLQARLPTDLVARLANIETALTNIGTCVCSMSDSIGGSRCIDPNQNFDEWEEEPPEWEGATPGTEPPPTGYASWDAWDDVVCGRINAYVEQIIEDLSWWENFLGQFGIGVASSVPTTSIVKGVARTFLAKQGSAVLLSKGLTQTSMVPGWAWIAWGAALVASAAGLLSGIIKSQVIDLRCSLINQIYGSRYGGSSYAKTRLDDWLHDNFYAIGSATPAFLAAYFLQTDFDILFSHLAWTDDPFLMNPCTCYDNMEMFDPYIWLRTEPATSITESGGLVTQWDNSGSWAGHFASVTSGARPALESGRVRFYASDNMRSYPAGHPKIYAVFCLWNHVSNGYILGRFNYGTDSWHYRPCFRWGSTQFRVALVSSNGSMSGNCSPTLPTGYNLMTIYSNTATQRTYVRLNGLEICSIAHGTGADFVAATAFLHLGGHPDYASAGAQFHLAELAMYDRELTIDEVEAIEPAIMSNNPGL